MLFTSLNFAAFVSICLIIYYVLPLKYRWFAIFCANFIFYADFGKRRLFCVLISAVSVWLIALLIQRVHGAEAKALQAAASTISREDKKALKANFKRKRLFLLAIGLVFNLGLLAFFKFYAPLAKTLTALPKLNILVPIGISFYTLSALSYVIDVYHKKIDACNNPLKLISFTMYFPQIIEGPINRFGSLAPQLFGGNRLNYESFVHGLQRILWGLFKKLVIADRIFVIVDTIFVYWDRYYGFEIFLGAVLYTIQLYADFSGGIDIALGVSELFGINLAENFNRPFFSKSIAEFWRRWHISLGAWLKDYLFYPLTLSKPLAKLGRFFSARKKKWAAKWIPSFIALFILWLCNGIWHGEGLQFIVFGLYHGILIMLGMSLEPFCQSLCTRLKINTKSQSFKLWRVVRTFCLVCYGEIIFRCSSLEQVFGMTKNMFTDFKLLSLFDGTLNTLGLEKEQVTIAIIAIVFLFMVEFIARRVDVGRYIIKQERPIRWLIYFASLFVVIVFGAYGPLFAKVPFIYFGF